MEEKQKQKDKKRRETKKHDFGDNYFYFQFFQTFRNLEINFGIKLNKCF